MLGNLFEGPHLIVVGLVLLFLFGGKKIPELMKGLGSGIKEFKKAASDVESDLTGSVKSHEDIKK